MRPQTRPVPARAALSRLTAALAVCALLLVHLLSGSQFVESALERAEFYSGTCLDADSQCHVTDGQVDLGKSPANALNLGVHLCAVIAGAVTAEPVQCTHARVPVEPSLALGLYSLELDHPPRA
jgi:hypothetical protein